MFVFKKIFRRSVTFTEILMPRGYRNKGALGACALMSKLCATDTLSVDNTQKGYNAFR